MLPCSAPVLTPPDLRSLGMPPANRPPSCGADAMALSPVSLLLRALFPGPGGARPGGAGGLPIPGTGGAPAMGAALDASLGLPTMGEERSLTWVTFLSLAPLPMSDSSAPCALSVAVTSRKRHRRTYPPCSGWRFCSWGFHSRHWRGWWWPSSTPSHGRHRRRWRRRRHLGGAS
jgi:hypothetical protein